MAVIGTGLTGSVTSWAGTSNANLIGSDAEFELNMATEIADATPLGVTSATTVAGLRSWSGVYTTRLSTPIIGVAGNVTFASGYTALDRGWSIVMTVQPTDTTDFSVTADRTFKPGIYTWSGSYNALLDDTTLVTATSAGNAASAAITLDMDGTNTFTGSVHVESLALAVNQADAAIATYGFTGNGALTSVGGGNLFPAGALGTPDTGAIVLAASTGQTYSGDAFLTNFSLNAQVDGLVEATVGFQGTGALTIA